MAEVIAKVSSMAGLRAALKERRQRLGIAQRAFDDVVGLPAGYTGKLEVGVRNYGDMSLECTMSALGVEILVIPSASRHDEIPTVTDAYRIERKKIASKGGKSFWAGKTPQEIKKIQSDRAKKRWEKQRATNEKRGRPAKKKGAPAKKPDTAQKPR